MKKLLSLFLVLSVIFIAGQGLFVLAETADELITLEAKEEKIYCKAKLEDEFSDSGILVVLNKSATKQSKTYATRNFPEIGCGSIIIKIYIISLF